MSNGITRRDLLDGMALTIANSDTGSGRPAFTPPSTRHTGPWLSFD